MPKVAQAPQSMRSLKPSCVPAIANVSRIYLTANTSCAAEQTTYVSLAIQELPIETRLNEQGW